MDGRTHGLVYVGTPTMNLSSHSTNTPSRSSSDTGHGTAHQDTHGLRPPPSGTIRTHTLSPEIIADTLDAQLDAKVRFLVGWGSHSLELT